MTEVSRYISDQAKAYAEYCQADEEYKEGADQQAMIGMTFKALLSSQLSEIVIGGSNTFRFTDSLITLMVNAILSTQLSLSSLSLTHHRISDVGLIQICRLILPSEAEVSGLRELDLQGNDIGVIGCAALEECLESVECNLESLNLSWNALTAKGGLMLAESLKV